MAWPTIQPRQKWLIDTDEGWPRSAKGCWERHRGDPPLQCGDCLNPWQQDLPEVPICAGVTARPHWPNAVLLPPAEKSRRVGQGSTSQASAAALADRRRLRKTPEIHSAGHI